ncbi:nucleic acid-binding, OB-fold-like protein [Artemisia annua]|uniref:Nucleic acid-binding, OB-fold-like protein n=1 Tax=Artemisia annua TaxID=35608 RepID=A0A2U1PIL9_ARTAN|nr:nucleic acid-binding, OB-fold-like protein [Artemisia annua]
MVGGGGFDRIEDALTVKRNNDRVNLIGVVSEMGFSKRTKGTDCICTLKIVDDSSPTVGIYVNIFQPQFEKLPHVNSAGDIILLSGLVVKKNMSLVNAVLYKDSGSFALYDGRDASSFSPYQASSRLIGRREDKKLFLTRLRQWSATQPNTASTDSLSMKEIKEGDDFNLICKVLHICCSNEGEWMLFVWDGTDAPPLTVNSDLEEEFDSPLALQLESSPLERDVLRKFPSVGTVLRMTVEQSNAKLGLHLFEAGKWVQFRNIGFAARSGLWCGILHAKSKFSLLPVDDDYVLQYQRNYGKRLKHKRGRMPNTCIPRPSSLTDTEHKDVPFFTLMNILSFREVTAKFRCVVRVVAIFPGHPSYFRSHCGGTYRIRLTLEDPTARIHAYLYAEDAEKFFGGYPSINTMFRMHNALLGIDETDVEKPRNPPWVQCCIKSYATDDTDLWKFRTYGIFDTTLEGCIG